MSDSMCESISENKVLRTYEYTSVYTSVVKN